VVSVPDDQGLAATERRSAHAALSRGLCKRPRSAAARFRLVDAAGVPA
jgi:hypothetical protein